MNITIPLRNRVAQADQARSQMEYRQAQMRLQQLYTQIRIQVINAQYALTNDRAQVSAAQAGREYAAQSLDAEQKKYKLGASTSATGAAAAEEPGELGEHGDFGDRGVCEGPRWHCCSCFEDTGPVRDQHHGSGMRRLINDSTGDSGLDGADSAGSCEADLGRGRAPSCR